MPVCTTVRSMSDDKTTTAIAPTLGNSVTVLADVKHPTVAGVLSAFPPEMRDKLKLTERQVQMIVESTTNSADSLSSTIPLLCKADMCEYKDLCLFHKLGKAPKGDRCPDEILFIEKVTPGLIVSTNLDTENYIEWDMIREFVDAMVQERRAERLVALHGELGEKISTIDVKTGQPYYEAVVHPANTLLEAATKRKARLRKDLLLTREMREKYKKDGGLDDAQRLSELRKRRQAAKDAAANAETAEFEVIPPEHRE